MRSLNEGKADPRLIFAILLNSYLESLSQTSEPKGPFADMEIEAGLVNGELVLACKHLTFAYPATEAGLLAARRDIEDIALLAAGAAEGLGDDIGWDESKGYYIERDGERQHFHNALSGEVRGNA